MLRVFPAVALAVGLGLAVSPAASVAQVQQDEPGPTVSDYLPPDQPEPSRDEWRQRIEEAKRRAKDVARERREHPEFYLPVQEDPDVVASERVLKDESLQRGDIVATKKGMFVYQGRPDQPRSEQDFVPIAPKPPH
ncbi:hypothetical protein UP09_07075 [Bradyrhizobium sp. LTSP885]|uniref:hypothetical protein n=1 Tax=Bradyrhizobium sp. LTSP885 TaxID=1619232 RepID=UPI0005CA162B|nr:hypothetical protein [Bradyrhizobium sp. LTSP885]KJC49526.1 hypothetical protein UP09_07075 [Bradyrhizobium sp. LTSP885]